jgi:hypothetical protein
VFAKCCAVILAIGVTACSLLALRQARLQAAHELAQTQLRIRALDEKLWVLRARIAGRVTPGDIEAMALNVGQLRPMIDAKPAADLRQADALQPSDPKKPADGKGSPLPSGAPNSPAPKPQPRPRDSERRWAEATR